MQQGKGQGIGQGWHHCPALLSEPQFPHLKGERLPVWPPHGGTEGRSTVPVNVLLQSKARARLPTWQGPLTPARQGSRPQDLLAAGVGAGLLSGGLVGHNMHWF